MSDASDKLFSDAVFAMLRPARDSADRDMLRVLGENYPGAPPPAPPAPVATLPSPKTERIAFLERKREATKADLLMKFEDADFHGVADAAMDLRDIESELKGLRF